MSHYLYVHPENPQSRLIKQAVALIKQGAVIAYPTDSAYALGCHIGDKAAMERIIRLRELDERHNFSLLCRDLSDIATYAKVDNATYRLLKACTPGAYTFVLTATSEVPKRLLNPKRKTIGIRVPDHAICQALLAELDEPLLTSTLQLPGDEYPLSDPEEVKDRLESRIDLIIDGGVGTLESTTVVDLSGDSPVILRQGIGDAAPFS
ncbi:MAG: threonylcarbamoyl-AMP synthase [Moraxellaceae bacterium]|jgi:tRNA threonylcarbamoyl adenosine modification protein (Sua5/YciO/YrdC/YwlC family)|nr:threonylcarbamoyl-AMP synthase [Moraxellaceae bacterium]MBP7230091.1 threonylcarbamoyl-AMP synthase [Moraxellaceae bacterium]MBP8853015.1 threonylcarbamoyl-AMP synthase [Moraxellaceae bacterium]MBP9730937.1 threonylcarbamoyl-AMP synthase [Moraxellaceae bacterium]MCC6199266.1 threonylcarbamoyl-AMP synthase [Moraxellaceae bacterium]